MKGKAVLFLFAALMLQSVNAANYYVYQENGTGYGFPAMVGWAKPMSINYTVPETALSALWLVKNNATNIVNITIPGACWNDSILQLQIWVRLDTGVTGSNWQECLANNGSWVSIGPVAYGAIACGGGGQPGTNLYDGSYSTYMGCDGAQWRLCGAAMGYYEEGIYWEYLDSTTAKAKGLCWAAAGKGSDSFSFAFRAIFLVFIAGFVGTMILLFTSGAGSSEGAGAGLLLLGAAVIAIVAGLIFWMIIGGAIGTLCG